MQYLYHYLHRSVPHNLSYHKYLDKLQSGVTFTFNWKFFFFPFIYSINHKMWIASLIFFNNYILGIFLADFFMKGQNLDSQTQEHMILFGFLGAHIFNCYVFNYFYHIKINNLIAKFGDNVEKFELKARPIGFYTLKNFELQCALNTIIAFVANVAFLVVASVFYNYLLMLVY